MKEALNSTAVNIRTERRDNDGIIYKYALVMHESSHVASYGIPLYYISVEMTDKNGTITKASTADVFADAGRAVRFFEKLVSNLATPIDLPYIVEDELSV